LPVGTNDLPTPHLASYDERDIEGYAERKAFSKFAGA
jgi:hypothetical protein